MQHPADGLIMLLVAPAPTCACRYIDPYAKVMIVNAKLIARRYVRGRRGYMFCFVCVRDLKLTTTKTTPARIAAANSPLVVNAQGTAAAVTTLWNC